MKCNRCCFVSVALVLLIACKPCVPEQYIQPDVMEDMLVDYHLAKALATETTDYSERGYNQAIYVAAVLNKYGYTQEDFDSSMAYYYKRADDFQDIYKRVSKRLEEQALVMGATEGEVGKYASLNADGDTANIWQENNRLALMTVAPYNKWSFSLDCDSTFKRGDSFLFQFMSDFMFQDGTKDAVAYLALTYDNDTTITRNIHFSASGLTQLRFPDFDEADIKKMCGFIYLNEDKDRSSTLRLLFLNNIQLIRFHKKTIEISHGTLEKDSLSSDSLGERSDRTSIGSRDL